MRKQEAFTLEVERTYVYKGTVTVEASNIEEARRAALDLIGDADLSMKEMVSGDDRVDGHTESEILVGCVYGEVRVAADTGGSYSETFNASPWLAQASNEEIAALLRADFGGSGAKAAARLAAEINPNIHYVMAKPGGCRYQLDRIETMMWLKENRKNVYELISSMGLEQWQSGGLFNRNEGESTSVPLAKR